MIVILLYTVSWKIKIPIIITFQPPVGEDAKEVEAEVSSDLVARVCRVQAQIFPVTAAQVNHQLARRYWLENILSFIDQIIIKTPNPKCRLY